MIKTLNELEIEELFLSVIKGMYERPTANIVFNGCFLSKIRNKTRMSALAISIEHHTGGSSQDN